MPGGREDSKGSASHRLSDDLLASLVETGGVSSDWVSLVLQEETA